MASQNPPSWRKLAIAVGLLLVGGAAAKASFREIQVLRELERFNQETGTGTMAVTVTVENGFSGAAQVFVPPPTYAQSVDVCSHFSSIQTDREGAAIDWWMDG